MPYSSNEWHKARSQVLEMHEKGYGMEVNYEKAIELYEKSASYGLEESMEKLEELRKILNINE